MTMTRPPGAVTFLFAGRGEFVPTVFEEPVRGYELNRRESAGQGCTIGQGPAIRVI